MKKGAKVQIDGIPGVVKDVKGAVAYVHMQEPVHFMMTPEGIAFEAIRPDMAEPMTDLLGYGTAQFLEDIHKLPSGVTMSDGKDSFGRYNERLYKLEKPMKLETIIDLCKKTHPGAPHCWLQAAYLNVIPLKV